MTHVADLRIPNSQGSDPSDCAPNLAASADEPQLSSERPGDFLHSVAMTRFSLRLPHRGLLLSPPDRQHDVDVCRLKNAQELFEHLENSFASPADTDRGRDAKPFRLVGVGSPLPDRHRKECIK